MSRGVEEYAKRNARHVRNLSIVLSAPVRPYLRRGGDIAGANFVGTPRTRQGRVAEVPIISVIDDDASGRESLASLFRSVGLQVKAFASATEFLQSRRPDCPSCLVLDVTLPSLNGLELQERIIDRVDMPIVFITGYGDVPSKVRARS